MNIETSMADVEKVEIHSIEPPRKLYDAELHIGPRGLPVVVFSYPDNHPITAHNSDLPANWHLVPRKGQASGVLLGAWEKIEEVMRDLAAWRNRHEGCGRVERPNEEFGGIED